MPSRSASLAALGGLAGLAFTVGATAQDADPVARGAQVYATTCAVCHGPQLGGAGPALPLAGPAFLARWEGLSAADLHKRISGTMPPKPAPSLSPDDYRAVTAYLLSQNGVRIEAGKRLEDQPIEPVP